jgi:hypothetical protein
MHHDLHHGDVIVLEQNYALNTIIGELSRIWRKEVEILRKDFFTLTPPPEDREHYLMVVSGLPVADPNGPRSRALFLSRTLEHASTGHFAYSGTGRLQMLTQREETITPTPRGRARLSVNGW